METKVGVKEFRANLPSYLESMSPIAITRHGETIGYYRVHLNKRQNCFIGFFAMPQLAWL
jgi:hypothetical protein